MEKGIDNRDICECAHEKRFHIAWGDNATPCALGACVCPHFRAIGTVATPVPASDEITVKVVARGDSVSRDVLEAMVRAGAKGYRA